MTEDQLQAFLAKLAKDQELQHKLKTTADLDAIVTLAREEGFEISKERWLDHASTQPELSSEDLEEIAGAHDESGCWICLPANTM
jgi:predicted ribosomally synthesized peptide with nif11-like leader